MKISIGADHRGFYLKTIIIERCSDIEFCDVGTHDERRTDYPLYAQDVCKHVLTGAADAGILICGSGQGMAIAANRHRGIYAALCWSVKMAEVAKAHDAANVLVLSADFVSPEDNCLIVQTWLHTRFLGGRYQDRLDMLDQCEKIT